MKPYKNTLDAILDVVAQQTRDSFTLHRHLYATDVRQDWPLYGDDDRRVLARYVNCLVLRSPNYAVVLLTTVCVRCASCDTPVCVRCATRLSM